MSRKTFSIGLVCLMSLFLIAYTSQAQDKITGPWLWIIAPTEANQGGAASTDVDSLAAASGDAVTEADVATNGANEGDEVGEFAWTLGEIADTGGNNANDLINRIGLVDGGDPEDTADDMDINDHSIYGLITLESPTAQSGVPMKVGSDDSVKVWLNGEVVHTNPVDRGAGDFQDEFEVNLVAGDNLLLVKVSERGGGWSLFAGVDADVTAVYKKPVPPVSGKITGPWLWIIAPTEANQGGAASTDVDSLAAASGDAVTEADVATNGANEGDEVGEFAWTLGEIADTGGNNANDLINRIGLVDGGDPEDTADDMDINDHSIYGLITLESPTAQSGVPMKVGSDDSVKVWLNGEVVHTNPVNRGAGDFQDDFKVDLVAGDNLLLVKVSERGGGWSLFAGVGGTDVTAVFKPTGGVGTPVEPAGKLVTRWGSLKSAK